MGRPSGPAPGRSGAVGRRASAGAVAVVTVLAGLLGGSCGRLPPPTAFVGPAGEADAGRRAATGGTPAGAAGADGHGATGGTPAVVIGSDDPVAIGFDEPAADAPGRPGPGPGDPRAAAEATSAVAVPSRWSGPLPPGAVAIADEASRPVRLRVPALGLDAPVVAAGVATDGRLELPGDPVTVAWFRGGAVPGDSGSAVLAAHVDHGGRPGAFFDLADLEVDSVIDVTLADSTSRTFRTTGAARTLPKTELPVPELFRRGGRASLTLVTCGGAFDPTARSYADNTLVSAAP